jgi:hypothetical protein
MDQAVARAPKPGPHRFKPGRQKEGGRRIGSTNKVPRLLKEAIMMAAELEGMDQRGKDKLVGFLRRVAREDLRGFVMLLGRVLPLQVESKSDEGVEVTYRSVDEVRRELASRGISMEVVARIMHEPLEVIDHEGVETVEAEG